MIDKQSNLQIIGGLMKRPQFLSQTDKYLFSPDDFSSRFEKFLFIAIDSLYREGATKISPIDVENFIQTNSSAKLSFSENNGVEYLQDAIELSQEESFPYYYKKIKKFNLLTDLQKSGMSIREFYIEDLTDPLALEINANFENLSVGDITTAIRKRLTLIEKDYTQNDATETTSIFEGIEEILTDAADGTDIGLPIQGDILNEVIAGARKQTLVIRSGSSGVSKAIPNYTTIPTPSGFRKVKDIKKGDYLIGQDGKPVKVVGVHPQPAKKQIYKVKFKDDRIAECCNEHLWEFQYKSHGEWKTKVADLQFLINKQKTLGLQDNGGGYRFKIPMNKAVQYEEKQYTVSPYAMGAILGDGCLREGKKNRALQFSSADEEIVKNIGDLMNWGYKKSKSDNYTWYFEVEPELKNGCWIKNIQIRETFAAYPQLINSGSYTKFIPKDYLLGSVEQRTHLLQGLLDTDGSIDNKGRVTYSTVSEQLKEDVLELCRSLGYIVNSSIILGEQYTQGRIFKINIQANAKEKANMFFLTRKKNKAIKNAERTVRREDKDFLPIVDIIETEEFTDMTCFTVDNKSHLFLMNDYIVTHNTRSAVGDACYLAYPYRYDEVTCSWVQDGSNEKVLFIATEQTAKQVQKMVLAYLTGMNESKFRYGDFTKEEQIIIKQAMWVIEKFKDNFFVVRMPNPTIELVKSIVRENVLLQDIGYVFYDYVFISPSLLNEFKGFNLRNDEILLMFTTALKDLTVELDLFLMTSTQLNAKGDDNKEIRGESALAGGRSTINKADTGIIMARPTQEELDVLETVTGTLGVVPNIVSDVFKNRGAALTQIRIWSDVDLGNLRKKDLFVTDSRLNVVEDFGNSYHYTVDWESTDTKKVVLDLKEIEKVGNENGL